MIILPAQIENLATRRDNTLKIIIGTQELPPEKIGSLFHLINKLAYVMIKSESFSQDEVDAVQALNTEDIKKKTLSQRMKSIFYLLHKNNNEGFKDFQHFYEYRMEKLILDLKDELENYN